MQAIRSRLLGLMHWITVLVFPLALVLGCESHSFKPEPALNDSTLFWKLELNHHAVMLSTVPPYDTLSLMAIPRNYQGEPIAGLPKPKYISRDIEKVAVREGVLVAVAPTNQPIWVMATLTTGNLKYLDSVRVKVVNSDPPPVLASFSVHPVSPDSAKLATRMFRDGILYDYPADTLPVRAAGPGDVPFESLVSGGVVVHFRSSDPLTASIHPTSGILTGIRPGTTTLYASTTTFGVTKADTLSYRIGFPIAAHVNTGDYFLGQSPGQFLQPEFHVGVGASVTWMTPDLARMQQSVQLYGFLGYDAAPFEASQVDITFDEADLPNIGASSISMRTASLDHCTMFNYPPYGDCSNGGNILLSGNGFNPANPPPYPLGFAARTFLVPGTYEYRSTIYGTRGRIVVVDERP